MSHYNFVYYKSKQILYLLFVFIVISCKSSKLAVTDNQKEIKKLVIYPTPPDTARIQYLTKITSSLDLGKKQSYFSKFILGEGKPKGLVKPYGMSIRNGKIYVCDFYGGGMEIIDLEKKDIIFFHPGGKGTFKTPVNCYKDENGYLYVADPGRYEILVFDDNGKFIKSFGEKEKFKPNDVVIYKKKIYVANSAAGKIHVYSMDSVNKLVYTFPNVEPGTPGHICMPTNIAINDDRIYVSDFFCPSIKVYNMEGEILDTIGSQGDRPGQFAKIKGIAVDKESNIYAVDAAFENVQMFNNKGQMLMAFGDHYKGPGDLVLPAKVMIDYDNLKYFEKYVDPSYHLKYLIFVSSQYGPDLINVYGRIVPKK